MLVHQAFRFELDPNNRARSALSSHAGAARFAYCDDEPVGVAARV